MSAPQSLRPIPNVSQVRSAVRELKPLREDEQEMVRKARERGEVWVNARLACDKCGSQPCMCLDSAQQGRRLLRGADAIKDYLNDRLAGGLPFSRRAVYRLIESGKIPVTRLGDRTEVLATTCNVDNAIGISGLTSDPKVAPPVGPDPIIGFGHIIAITMAAHWIPSDRYTAWASNIKYLQRQKVVPSKATARGRRGIYSRNDILLALFATELQRVGLTPEQMRPIIEGFGSDFMQAVESGSLLSITVETSAGRSASLTIDVPGLIAAAERAVIKGFAL